MIIQYGRKRKNYVTFFLNYLICHKLNLGVSLLSWDYPWIAVSQLAENLRILMGRPQRRTHQKRIVDKTNWRSLGNCGTRKFQLNYGSLCTFGSSSLQHHPDLISLTLLLGLTQLRGDRQTHTWAEYKIVCTLIAKCYAMPIQEAVLRGQRFRHTSFRNSTRWPQFD